MNLETKTKIRQIVYKFLQEAKQNPEELSYDKVSQFIHPFLENLSQLYTSDNNKSFNEDLSQLYTPEIMRHKFFNSLTKSNVKGIWRASEIQLSFRKFKPMQETIQNLKLKPMQEAIPNLRGWNPDYNDIVRLVIDYLVHFYVEFKQPLLQEAIREFNNLNYADSIKLFEKYLIGFSGANNSFAKQNLREARIKQPFKPLLQEAIGMFNDSNYTEAIKLFEKYLVDFSEFNSEHNLIAKQNLRGARIKQPFKPLLQEAIGMFNDSNYTEAIKLFEKYLVDFNEFNSEHNLITKQNLIEARIKEAIQKFNDSNYSDAIKIFEKYLVDFSEFNNEHNLIAKQNLSEARIKEVIQKFNDSNYTSVIKFFEKYLVDFSEFNSEHDVIIKLHLREARIRQPFKSLLQEAIEMFNNSNYTEAIKLFEKYLVDFSEFNSEHNLIAKQNLSEARIKEAIQKFNDSNYTDAIKLFEKYLVDFGEFNSEHNLIAKKKLREARIEQPFKSLLQEAIESYNDSNYTEATKLFEKYLVDFIEFNSEHNLITKLYLERTKTKQLEESLKQALKLCEKELFSDALKIFENYLDILTLFEDSNKSDLQVRKPRSLSKTEMKAYFDCILDEYLYPMYRYSEFDKQRRGSRVWVYSHSDIMDFGKYKGEKLFAVIEKYPSYIIWCIFNIGNFSISDDLCFNKNLRSDPKYLFGLTYNIGKRRAFEEWDAGWAEREEDALLARGLRIKY